MAAPRKIDLERREVVLCGRNPVDSKRTKNEDPLDYFEFGPEPRLKI
jgi:hypothetical protein